MKEIAVEIQIVGRRYERVLREMDPNPANRFTPANRVFTWIWDGRDGEGRLVEGAQNATIRVGYGYEGQYAATPDEQQRSFAAFEGGASTTLGVARGLLFVWEARREQLGLLSARTAGLGGWTLDVHHAYDPLASTLYLGTGHRRTAATLGRTVRTIAGGASGNTGEGPALERELLTLRAVAVRRDGVLYFSHSASSGSTVRRLAPTGPGGALVIENVLPRVAGAPGWTGEHYAPAGIAFGPDDTLYIAEQSTARVLALPARCLARPAPGDCSDASAATYVQLPTGHAPEGLAVGPDGILYVSVPSQHVVYQVRPNGPGPEAPIAPVAVRAAGEAGEFGDRDGPVAGAMSARLRGPGELAIARDGSVLIADAGNCRVRRLDPSGRVRTVAGNGCGGALGLDGTLATASSFRSVRGLAIDRVGGFYFGGGDNAASTRVWRVAPDGTFATVARTVPGVGAGDSFGDGRLATEAAYNGIAGLALDPNGALVLLDGLNNRIRRIAPALPNVPLDAYVLPSEDGGALYRFDARGRHVETRDALTGQVLFEFGYTQGNARLLERVIDRRLDGQRTTQIVRTGSALTSIVAPSGQTTALAGLSQGDLTRVEPPHGGEAAEPWAFTYEGEQGLLASMTEPTGATHRYDYDALGRLTHDSDGAGATQTLTRTENETVDGLMRPVRRLAVTLSSPMGRNTIFASAQREDGFVERSSTDSAARVATSTRDDEGRTEVTLADGTRIRRETAADPRLGGASKRAQAPS